MKSLYRRVAMAIMGLLLLSSNMVSGQTDCEKCDKIRRDSHYYWAESKLDENEDYVSYEDARNSALQMILQNVSQQVVSSANITGHVINGTSTVEYDKSLKSYSHVFLEDLTVIELSSEPKAKVPN